ncbi:MFS transporter [Sphingobium sp. BS19]|uniref:MFS transporter n=1 Tax=Sphingobium sp. BS19 TaxID=3018973 RepID=UPI0022ED7BC0|nr:MFS transporter [Sphingobium sp. BS19]GLJ00511.1 MFS transporter [Sphingobium sp. BS19]
MANQTRAGENYPSLRRAYLTLTVLVVAFVIAMVDRQILSLMVAPMRKTLGISNFEIGLLQGTAFVIFYCCLSIPIGRIADRYNRRNLIAIGMLLWSFATVACAFADNFWTLFLARLCVGVGEAALAPAGYSLIADSFRPDRLVRPNQIFSMGAMLGAGTALLIGGPALDFTAAIAPIFADGRFEPWQLVFILVGLPGIALSAATFLLIKEPKRLHDQAMPSLKETFHHIWKHRSRYFPLYACAALLTVIFYANLGWLPTHFINSFAMTPGEVGLLLGIALIPSALLGAYLGPMFTALLARRGYADAHMRTVLIVSLIILLPVSAPLIDNRGVQLAAVFCYFLLQNSYFGAISASIQLSTPNRMRAVGMALLFLIVNLVGLGGGAALVGWFADNVFVDDKYAIGHSVVLVGCAAALASALVAAATLKRYRLPLADANATAGG